jgi:hypothetical protein
MGRVLEMPKRHRLYRHRPAPPHLAAGASSQASWRRRAGPAPPAPPPGGADIGGAVRRGLLDLMHGLVDITKQEVCAVGPRPARRHEVALRACVGLVPECEFGPYGSRERRQAEDGMLCAMGKWTQAEGGVRPTGVIGGGWTITRLAAMVIYPVGGPSTAAMQQLRHWLADGGIRLPLASDPSVMVVVPCMACPGELPLGQVQVTFRGLPSAFMLKDTVHTILRAVGYTGDSRRAQAAIHGGLSWLARRRAQPG